METIAYTVSGTTTEISLTALGVGLMPRLTLGTHGPSKFTLPLPGTAPETAAVIPFEAPCTIYTGRTGSGTSWSGGSKLFQGRRTDNSGDVSGSRVSSELVIEDAWYDLRFLTMQATWKTITGGTISSPTYGTASWPDCVLFQATPGVDYTTFPSPNNAAAVNSHITTGQAIIEILNYAISCGVNLQIGTINPALYVPFYPIRSMRCADALKIALRVHPDCATEIDYTSTPPTFNIRQRSNLTSVTLPYAGSSSTGSGSSLVTKTHLTSQIKPRPDLVPTRVGIYIKTTGSLGGQPSIAIGTDIYPAVASGLRSFDTSLDMAGPRISLVSGQITTYAAAATAAFTGESGAYSWWSLKVPAFSQLETVPGSAALVNTAINDGSKNCITVVDESGSAINLTTYSAIMEHEGTVHPWMNIQSVKAIVTGYFTYQRRKNIGTAGSPVWVDVNQPSTHPHPVRVHLCTAPVGTTTNYQQESILSTGEVYPTGLAEAIYNSLTTLQYQFNHTILEQPFSTIIKPGKHCLNVSGGASDWSGMNALVQEVTVDFINSPAGGITSAKTSVRCGPVEHLEPGQLIQLTNIFQNRDLSKINPNERTSGLPNGGANAEMPSETAKENTTPAPPDHAFLTWAAFDSVDDSKTNVINHDPANGTWSSKQLVNSTGAVNPSAPSVTLAHSDITAASVPNIAAKFQSFTVCLNDGTIKTCAILATVPG